MTGLSTVLSAFRAKSAEIEAREEAEAYGASELAKAALVRLDALKEREALKATSRISLKEFMLSEQFAAPYLKASAKGGPPISRVALAVIDAIDGNPITTITTEEHERIFGCKLGEMTPKRARTYVVSAGGRSGKTSRFLTCVAVWCAWTVPLPTLSPGEDALAFLTAPKRVLAKRCLKFITGLIGASPVLSKALVKPGAEAVLIERPDGKRVSIEVTAKGNLSGRGGTCVFYGVDEAEFFLDTAAQDLDEQVKGAEQRVEPGGMIGIVSTPFIEGEGVMQQTIVRERGKHEGALVCEKISTRELNTLWDLDGTVEASMRRKPGGDLNVAREVYAIPYPKGTKRFFNAAKLREAMTRLSNKAQRPAAVGAGSDLGMRRDGCALVVAKRYPNGQIGAPRMHVVRPVDGPLVPSMVCAELAETAREHGAASVAADGVYAETYREHLNAIGLGFIDAPGGREGKIGLYTAAYQVFADDRVCLGDMPEDEREDLVDQLSRITTKKLPGGSEEIVVPRRIVRTEADAAQATTDHCDGAAAFVIALWASGAGAGVKREGYQPGLVLPQGAPHAQEQLPQNVGFESRGVTVGSHRRVRW